MANLQRRYVDHARDTVKDKIIILREHLTSANYKYHDLLYFVFRIQLRNRYIKPR